LKKILQMEKILKGKVVEIKDTKIVIDIDGEMKTFHNDLFNLRVGEKIEFELVFINKINKAVILDKIID
jgi:hypothetical protein